MVIEFRADMITRADDYTIFEPVFNVKLSRIQLLALQSEVEQTLLAYDRGELEDEDEELLCNIQNKD